MQFDFDDIQQLKQYEIDCFEQVKKILDTYRQILFHEISTEIMDYVHFNGNSFDKLPPDHSSFVDADKNLIHLISKVEEYKTLKKKVEKIIPKLLPQEQVFFDEYIIQRKKFKKIKKNELIFRNVMYQFAYIFIPDFKDKVERIIQIHLFQEDIKDDLYQKIKTFVLSVNTKKVEKFLLKKELETLNEYRYADPNFTSYHGQQFYIYLKRAIYTLFIFYRLIYPDKFSKIGFLENLGTIGNIKDEEIINYAIQDNCGINYKKRMIKKIAELS
ncbi:hypothetical protein [Bulleidia sp. zg-1006]|nr:hypothetical protein [Bulleidia sp. zg-1006]